MCRSRRELSNEYLLAKIGVDTAENEPLEVWGENSIQYSIVSLGFIEKLEIQMPSILGSWGSAVVRMETGVLVLVPQDTNWELHEVGAAKANWVANKRFEISKFKFKIPRARTSELQGSFSAVSKPNFASKYSLESS